MLRHLTLHNYRRHEHLTVHFGPGLNTIRGANEIGKTTTLESIVYAWFGARALPEPLEDVVTYGQPVSKLRVDLAFEFLGVEYELYRAKSGCELTFGPERITGQTEVTKYMESLFKVNAEMAGRLMLAEQTDLRGILSHGATAAGRMMEYLANFDLLDRIVELVQTKLPSGNTDILDSRIKEMEAKLAEPVVESDVPRLEAAVAGAGQDLTAALNRHSTVQKQLAALDTATAGMVLQKHASMGDQISQIQAQAAELEHRLAQPGPMAVQESELSTLREWVAQVEQIEKLSKLHDQLKKADVAVRWDEPYQKLVDEIALTEGAIAVSQNDITAAQAAVTEAHAAWSRIDNEYKVALTRLEGQLIKETTCALCQKDLTDVPEVVQRNSQIHQQIQELNNTTAGRVEGRAEEMAQLEEALQRAKAALADGQNTLRQLLAVQQYNGTIEALYAKAEDYITLDRSVVPAQWTWTGPDTEGEYPDYAGQLAALETRDREHHQWAGTQEQRRVQLDTLRKQGNELASERDRLDVIEAQNVIGRADSLRPEIQFAQDALQQAQASLRRAETELATAKALAEQAARQRQQLEDQLKQSRTDLTAMQGNNVLIKKVRAARPEITTKLWNLVLAAVSKDLTTIREQESIITRDGDRFLINGNPVAGLSGSAKDSLGLAIRIALVKTFIPNVSFMSLDEPAAACSDEREVSMLGLLATTGFDQILLVTHSDLADSFSNHIINI